ncbi:Plant invertase/pectin methylesterase inhibitor superfamily protein [Abeliophyllum distichum]|uniref:Plant invertase/pectin methylesterase inhibitor superfamily protein n=1 Tax=Abeliophyllum distichum TaxID=126358 RepID=A0ABD1Q8B5_9LAMI
MANFSIHLLLLLSSHYMLAMANSATNSNPDSTNFIKKSCRATRYPALCIQSLSSHASTIRQSELQLAQVALAVSLSRAQSAASFISKLPKMKGIKPREYRATKDCIEIMGDSVDQLSRSIKELGGMRRRVAGEDFAWHVSNVQTWVSAALTNENTCLDGFSGPSMNGNAKVAIRKRVLNVAQVTSNALALVNRFAARHGFAETTNLP